MGDDETFVTLFEKYPPPKQPLRSRRPDSTVDLHGLRRSDVRQKLNNFLASAWEAGYTRVAVIHGNGRGSLRDEVRSALAVHPAVRHAEPAATRSGGEGVTIVTLVARPLIRRRDR